MHLQGGTTGKRSDHSQTVRASKKDADEVLRDLLLKRDSDTLLQILPATVGKNLEHWIVSREGAFGARTPRGYRDTVDRDIRPHIGATALPQCPRSTITGSTRSCGPTGGLGNKLIGLHALLRNALCEATQRGLIEMNATINAEKARCVKHEMRSLTNVEESALLRTTRDDRFVVYFHLALHTRMRPGELLAVHWGDSDLPPPSPAITL